MRCFYGRKGSPNEARNLEIGWPLLRRFGAGYEKIDVPACTAASIVLSTSNEGVRRPVAVMLLTLILAVTGKLLIKDRLARAEPERWEERIDHMGVGLVGKTLGLIGVGNTGAETVKLAKPLDMNFIAYDPYVAPEVATSLGIRMVSLEEVFRKSDILAVACPLTKETHHLVNKDRLALMKPTAFLVNGARGPIVDQPALVNALKSGRIAGAGLDVFEKEPIDRDDPIKQLDNVILSPHALCWTDQCFTDCFKEATDAVLRVMTGREPLGIINREVLQDQIWHSKLASYRQRFGEL
jgi:phosphoglycerate dehydrogenase-like enzyme